MKYSVDANTIVICIDVGDKYVGVVGYYNYELCYTNQLIHTGDYIQLLEPINEFISLCKAKTKCIVVVEDFLKYGHKANIKHYTANHTSQMIGVIELWTQMNDYVLVKQKASQAKVWNDKRLMYLNLLFQTTQHRFIIDKYFLPRHTRDAYRHLIYFLNKHLFNGFIDNKKFKIKKI